jgi:hypothetical protein
VCGPDALPLAFGRSLAVQVAPRLNPRAASCLRRDSPTCLFSFDVARRSDLRVALASLGFDAALALYFVPPGMLASDRRAAEVTCIDDTPLGDTQHVRLDLSLEPGSYALAVAAPPEQVGQFELFAELEPLEPLSRLCHALPILTEGVFERGSTRGGASSFGAACGARAAGPDQPYAFALTESARVRLRMQAEFDAVLSLRSRCDMPESEFACNDDSPSGQPLLTAELAPGAYVAVVDAAARGEGGEFVLTLQRAPMPAPQTEDQACAALPQLSLGGPLQELDTFLRAGTHMASCGGEGAPDAAFQLRVPRAGIITLRAADFEFEPVFSLRRACEYAESELVCAALPRGPLPAPADERVAFQLWLPAGDYALLVDGQTPGSMGAGSVRVTFEPGETPSK